MPLHAYRLVYPDRLHGSELRWEWAKEHITRLFWNAATFERELARQYCLTWNSLAEEN